MARPLRIQYPGAWYHVTSRGNERKAVFWNDTDRKKFLSYLQSAHERYGAIIHCFCLLSNHYHLLLETPRGNLSQILHHINGAYTTYFNTKRKRCGHLFQGRFKAILVEKEVYAQELSRYIHLNPVRSGIVEDLISYAWSSYPNYAGLQENPLWLENRVILGYFSADKAKAHKRYRAFVEGAIGQDLRNPLKEVVASTMLGSKEFIERALGRGERSQARDKRDIPALKALQRRPTLIEMEKQVEAILPKENANFRKFCLYLSHRFGGYSLQEIGGYYGMKGAAVSQAARRFRQLIDRETELKKIEQKVLEKFGMLKVET